MDPHFRSHSINEAQTPDEQTGNGNNDAEDSLFVHLDCGAESSLSLGSGVREKDDEDSDDSAIVEANDLARLMVAEPDTQPSVGTPRRLSDVPFFGDEPSMSIDTSVQTNARSSPAGDTGRSMLVFAYSPAPAV